MVNKVQIMGFAIIKVTIAASLLDDVSLSQGFPVNSRADLRKNHVCGNRPTRLPFYRLTSLVFELFSAQDEAVVSGVHGKRYVAVCRLCFFDRIVRIKLEIGN